tara:strand:- start:1223 stop:1678 length:456 start_codon:yes stop_codon:yes gene_type:complete
MWTSIEIMPIYNFHKTLSTGELKYTLQNPISDKELIKNQDKIEKNWEGLYDEYLEHFGLAKNLLKRMEIEDKIAKLMINRWLNDNKSLEAIIEIEKLKLNEVDGKKKKSSSFEEDIAIIEKYMAIGLDVNKTSVKRFYTYIKIMQKDGEKN